MRRRDFISLLGSAAAWPLAARAQQRRRILRFGLRRATNAGESAGPERGRVEGQNVAIEYTSYSGDDACATAHVRWQFC
jgi:putative ABC transport system substrate-binding protein